MQFNFSKYEGTGNDFIVADNRSGAYNNLGAQVIKKLCDRRFGIGADGLLLLNHSDTRDYYMAYYNADGNVGSMCGNGGRCLAAFAKRVGAIISQTVFDAYDGLHEARIENYDTEKLSATVFLRMNDVHEIEHGDNYYFLDTGSPHYVVFVNDPDKTDVVAAGKAIRYNNRFKEKGTNVNFISFANDVVRIRTYERGVEDETLSCGTGAVASVLVAAEAGFLKGTSGTLQTNGGKLRVHFEKTATGYKNIFLEGPATFVYDGVMEI